MQYIKNVLAVFTLFTLFPNSKVSGPKRILTVYRSWPNLAYKSHKEKHLEFHFYAQALLYIYIDYDTVFLPLLKMTDKSNDLLRFGLFSKRTTKAQQQQNTRHFKIRKK